MVSEGKIHRFSYVGFGFGFFFGSFFKLKINNNIWKQEKDLQKASRKQYRKDVLLSGHSQ